MGSKGNVQGGIQNDVSLNVKPSELGDVLAISLAQDATSRARWKIVVRCMTDQGAEILGSPIITRAPALNVQEAPSRLVGGAFWPGAKGWSVTAFVLPDVGVIPSQEQADLKLTSSRQGGAGLPPGTFIVATGTGAQSGVRTAGNPPFTLLGPVSQLLAPPGSTLWQLEGDLVQANVAGASTFVQLFDSAGPPVLGAVPFWEAHLGQVVGGPPDPSFFKYLAGPNGRLIVNGLFLGVSTTSGTFTPDAAHTVNITAEVSTGQ